MTERDPVDTVTPADDGGPPADPAQLLRRASAAAERARDLNERTRLATAIGLVYLTIISVAFAIAVLILVSRDRGDQPPLPLPLDDVIAVLAAAVAIALIFVGLNAANAPTPTGGNYIERELNEQRARRGAMTAIALVIIGVVLLATAMITSGARASDGTSSAPTLTPAASTESTKKH